MNQSEITKLVDHAGIAAARDDLLGAARRRDAGLADFDAKKAAAAACEKELDRILADIAAGREVAISPEQAYAKLADAENARGLAAKLHGALCRAHHDAEAAHMAAIADAWGPVMKFAAEERVAAARDFQAALSGLKAAVVRSGEAAQIAEKARANGAHFPPGNGAALVAIGNHPSRPQPPEFAWLLRTPDAEKEIWEGVL